MTIEKASTYFLDGAFTATGNLGSTWTPEPGSTNPPPDNGDPPPAPVEAYHWFQDGNELSILVKDQKLNDKIISAQAWYRGGMFAGHILLDKTEPQANEPLMVFPRRDHIPFMTGGLARSGLGYGSGWYANGEKKDAAPALIQWMNYGLQFLVPNPNGKLSLVKAGYPSDWGGYGLFLSWEISVP